MTRDEAIEILCDHCHGTLIAAHQMACAQDTDPLLWGAIVEGAVAGILASHESEERRSGGSSRPPPRIYVVAPGPAETPQATCLNEQALQYWQGLIRRLGGDPHPIPPTPFLVDPALSTGFGFVFVPGWGDCDDCYGVWNFAQRNRLPILDLGAEPPPRAVEAIETFFGALSKKPDPSERKERFHIEEKNDDVE